MCFTVVTVADIICNVTAVVYVIANDGKIVVDVAAAIVFGALLTSLPEFGRFMSHVILTLHHLPKSQWVERQLADIIVM